LYSGLIAGCICEGSFFSHVFGVLAFDFGGVGSGDC
jgi:hypothetical protein